MQVSFVLANDVISIQSTRNDSASGRGAPCSSNAYAPSESIQRRNSFRKASIGCCSSSANCSDSFWK